MKHENKASQTVLILWTLSFHKGLCPPHNRFPSNFKGKSIAVFIRALDERWGFQDVEAPRISRHLAHEGGKVVSLKYRSLLPPQVIFLVLIFVIGWVNPRAIVWLEGLCQWKIPVTSTGIGPATFWLLAQCLNQLRHRVHFPSIFSGCNMHVFLISLKRATFPGYPILLNIITLAIFREASKSWRA
jgi:hypothetical protein